MFFHSFFNSQLATQSFIIGDLKTKRCAVIDPIRQVVSYLMIAQEHGLEITDILETHVHADFVSGAKELKAELNNKPTIWSSALGGEEWYPHYADQKVDERTEINLGSIRLKALHTPGHTPEHISWVCFDNLRSQQIPWLIFTGDSLFVDSIGRPDLLGEKETSYLAKQLYHTLFTTFAAFPDYVEIYPSHGAGSACGKSLNDKRLSTLGYERLFNPYLKKYEINDWIEKLLEDLPAPPSSSLRMKKLNIEGTVSMHTLKTHIWSSSQDQSLDELFLIDIRSPDVFADSHLKNTLNIPLNPSFCKWAGTFIPFQQPLGLVSECQSLASQAIENLRLIGFDQEIWIISMSEHQQILSTHQIETLPLLNPQQLQESINKNTHYLLDVRTQQEWNEEHICQAHQLELDQLEKQLLTLPKEKSIAVICKSGARASLAASLLKKNGFSQVYNVQGGMLAWKQTNRPILCNQSEN